MPSDIPQAVHATEFQKTRHTLSMAVDCEHKMTVSGPPLL